MRLNLWTILGLGITGLSLSFTLFANSDTKVPEQNTIAALQKSFTFNWNNYLSIEANKNKVQSTEKFIKNIKDLSKLNDQDRRDLGLVLFRLGTYYAHIARDPDAAIEKLNQANNFLTIKREKAWNYDQLAFAYEQKYAASHHDEDKRQVFHYTNLVINNLYENEAVKEVAFAYCVKGIVFNNAGDLEKAEKNIKTALNIYEQIPGAVDDQYTRVKGELASIVLNQSKHDERAITMMEQVNQYWQAKPDADKNPYAARNLIALAQGYFKVGKTKSARNSLLASISIYSSIYGENNNLLIQPYVMLANSYEKEKDIKQALVYSDKAKIIENYGKA